MSASVPVIAASVIRLAAIINFSSIIPEPVMIHDMVLLPRKRKEPYEQTRHQHAPSRRPPRGGHDRPPRAAQAGATGAGARVRAGASRQLGASRPLGAP